MKKFCCDCPQWCGNIRCCALEVPEFLRVPKEDRAAAWLNMPPPPPPIAFEVARTEDPATIALREELEASKRAKTGKRIDKLLASKAVPIDHSGERWDAHRNRWVAMVPLLTIAHHEAPEGPDKPVKPRGKPQKPKALSVASKPHKRNKKPIG